MPEKRPHRPTGKPRGGAREGAGRPKGPSALGYGEAQAVKSLRWRVPENAPDEVKALADRAFQRIAQVMEEGVHPSQCKAVLGAATRIREEVCGPLAQKHLVGGDPEGGPLVVEIKKYTTEGEPWPTASSLQTQREKTFLPETTPAPTTPGETPPSDSPSPGPTSTPEE